MLLFFSITHTEKESRVKSNDFGKKIMVQPLIPGNGSVIQERAVCTPADKFAATEDFTDRESLALYSNRNTGEESKNEREDFNPQQRRRNGGDSGTNPHTANTAVGF